MSPILVSSSVRHIATQILVIAKLNVRKFIDFKQAKVCLVHIQKINTFENKIRYIMRYVVVI